MALTPQLNLHQTQSLIMTPRLQQAIKLLQMSNLEITQFLEKEIQQNPLLVFENPDISSPATCDSDNSCIDITELEGGLGKSTDFVGDIPETGNPINFANKDHPKLDHRTSPNTKFENTWSSNTKLNTPQFTESNTLHWQIPGPGNFDLGDPNIVYRQAEELTLRDHLIGQINVDLGEAVDRIIAVYLVDALDDAGYLHENLAQIAENLGCDLSHVECILHRVQQLDPPGTFARSLSECLALQLKDRGRYSPAMQVLLDNLKLLGKKEFQSLHHLCGVGVDEIKIMVDEIKSLDPKPALNFDQVVTQIVTPDVSVRRKTDNKWLVEINDEALPRALINQRYFAEVNKQATRKEDKEFISECYQTASWLVRSLHQRTQTILKVTTEIMRQQQQFLEHGVQHLKPLVLRDIGKELKIHESTVSRATTNKYISTPRGVFALKYFFTSAASKSMNCDQCPSGEAIRYRIKALIDAELLENILSDDQIVSILQGDGIHIARRTIAKYRNCMKIPSSVQRRCGKSIFNSQSKGLN